MLDKIPAS